MTFEEVLYRLAPELERVAAAAAMFERKPHHDTIEAALVLRQAIRRLDDIERDLRSAMLTHERTA
ncbi:MAG: hypothetical protein FJ033_16105 [Chloroflexi bacterium]|nr:hypothetical protein [Chloroflexota bacterium]